MGADYTAFAAGKFALDVNIVGGLSQLSAGVSTMGNTAGTTGTVDQQIVFVGGSNITLSESTNLQSATITIIGNSQSIQPSLSAGVSNLGNSSGTTGTVSQQLVFVGGSNITLSESINAQSATITINAATQAATVVDLSISGTNTAGTLALISSGTAVLFGGSNITLSQSGTQNITISNYPGLLKPELQNTNDIGASYNWIKTAVTGADIRGVCYLGSGVVILGTTTGHIWRSVDYGFTWVDLGQIVGANQVWAASYQGNGIVVLSDSNGHIWGSTNYGVTWTDEGQVVGPNSVRSISYCGDKIVVAVVDNGHIFRSTNDGSTWVDLGAISANAFIASCYLDKQVVLAGDLSGRIFKSTDQGATWALIVTATSQINTFSYLGNGTVIAGTNGPALTAGVIIISHDYGATWATTSGSASGTAGIMSTCYDGNGNALFTDGNAHIFKSIDFGNTWTDEGVIGTTSFDFNSIVYISNGITIAGDSTGNVVRGDVSYKLDECMVANSLGISTIGHTSGTTGLGWQQVVFAGGNNVTLSQSITNGSATVTISAFNQTTQTQNLIDLTLSGNTTGTLALMSSGTVTIAGGNNIVLSQAGGNAFTISGSNMVSQLDGSTGSITLVAGNLISISNSASTISVINLLSSATTVSSVTSANVIGAMASRFALEGHQHAGVNAAGVSNLGNTSGSTAVLPGQLILAGGNNVTLSQSTDASNGMTVTISAGTGTAAASTFQAGVSTGGNTAGSTGTVSAQMVLVGGNSITLSESTNGGSNTVSVIGQSAIRFVTEVSLAGTAQTASIGNFVSSNEIATLHVFITNTNAQALQVSVRPILGAGTVATAIQTRVGISQVDGGGPSGVGDQSGVELRALSGEVAWGIIDVWQTSTIILLQARAWQNVPDANSANMFPHNVIYTISNATAITGFHMSAIIGTMAAGCKFKLYAGRN